MNKKLLNTSFTYAILAMISGVFYREFTKFNGYTDFTALGVTHVHLFAMGMLMFLLLLGINKHYNFTDHKDFNRFYMTYNIGVISKVIMLYVRGITQVKAIALSKGADAAISGIAGLSHIVLGVGVIFLFLMLRKVVND